jgi:hypothetical protein
MLIGDAHCQRRRTFEARQKSRQGKIEGRNQRRGGESP